MFGKFQISAAEFFDFNQLICALEDNDVLNGYIWQCSDLVAKHLHCRIDINALSDPFFSPVHEKTKKISVRALT